MLTGSAADNAAIMAKSAPERTPALPGDLTAASLQSDATNALVRAVDTYLQQILQSKIEAANKIDSRYGDLLAQIKLLVSRGGKRLRPRLVVAAYTAYGGTNEAAICRVAASQELYHAFILMHDDIIDRDTVRWGGPNITGHYLQEFEKLVTGQDARHYADAWALLAGNICYNLSNELLLDSGFPPKQVLKAIGLVQQTLFTMIGGELLDVALPLYYPLGATIDDQQLLRVCDAKTASYSFCTPLRLGALLAGASGSQDKQLNAFGTHLGIAFQLRDDVLGIFGEAQRLGKSTLSDIQEAKRTMLMGYALRAADGRQKRQLQRILGNPAASPEDLQTVKTILRVTGALSRIEAMIQKHCQQAHHIVLGADFPARLSNFLADLTAFCADREY